MFLTLSQRVLQHRAIDYGTFLVWGDIRCFQTQPEELEGGEKREEGGEESRETRKQ